MLKRCIVRKHIGLFLVFCLLFQCFTILGSPTKVEAATAVSAIFGGGPFVTGGQPVMNQLKASGFNTVIIWSVHPQPNGDLYINDVLVCQNGNYVGDPAWATAWQSLKTGTTSVTRVEISVGAWGCSDFENIQALINANGTGSNTILYRNFLALKNATGADAVNFDDESLYNVNTTVQFGQMCAAMGMKVTLCPYTNSSFWSSVKSQLGSIVDRVYLQCYAGGAGNSPSSWKSIMGMNVIPGLWCLHSGSQGDSASSVQAKLTNWKSSSDGGFIWLYDDLMKLSSPNSTADYANAINSVFTTPTSNNIALNKTATANQYVTNETPAKAVDGSIAGYGNGNSKWCSDNSDSAKWLKIDLGQTYNISRWVVKHAGIGGESTSYNTKNFKLQKSTDGINWTDVDTVTNNTSNITDRTVTAFSARYVRLYITAATQSTSNIARIYEFELY
jgi:hypothetical protein